MVIIIIVIKSTGNEGQTNLFSNLFRGYIEETSASITNVSTESQNQLADINSLAALSNRESSSHGGKTENTFDPSTIQENSLQAFNPSSTDYMDGFKSDQVVKYTVQSGDTIGSIASNFDVSINTIVWANNLTNPNILSLGQVLKIPPVSGVIYAVKTGDTVASIAKKYKADPHKISSFNRLEDGQALVAGNELMIPGGEQPGPVPSIKPAIKALAKDSGNHGIYIPTRDGQCVSFVQAHGYSKLRGNAKDWVKYKNTTIPQVGGVVVFAAGRNYGRYGHVALITAVKSDSIQVVEQNFYGLRIIDHREVPLSDKAIVAFIK